MGHVYWERPEIDIPSEAHINHSDGRVYLMDEHDANVRIVIGHATSETKMHPNDRFRLLFPGVWEEAYSKYNDPKGIEIHVGMYGLALGASYHNGLYPVLQEAYGPKYANAIMDYAMYSLFERSDVSQHFPERMRKEVLFSRTPFDDSAYSALFKEKLTEEMHDAFRVAWVKHCISRGMTKVWICIDGSNNDCQTRNSEYAEHGDNKSHSGKTIVGYIYAVDSATGVPIAYTVNPGGVVDSQAFQKIINLITGYGLEVEGTILDRGFCTYEVVQTLRKLELDFVIMTPHDTYGHTLMLEKHGESIFWDPEYLVDNRSIYGISDKVQIWGKYPDEGFFSLLFSARSGYRQGGDFNEEILAAKAAAEKACAEGKMPVFSQKTKPFFEITQGEDGKYHIRTLYAEWKKRLRQKGFCSILTSQDFGPARSRDIYDLRMASETQYRLLKSQEGFDTTRVHTDKGMMSKYAVCFAASILRHTIMTACLHRGLDTNEMIRRMDRLNLLVLDEGRCVFVRDMSRKAQDLFEEFNMNMDSFDEICKDYNRRKTSTINSQVHEVPTSTPRRKGKPGRKPGSKNKKTLEREAAKAAAIANGEYVDPAPRKRGRPVGSVDTKPRKQRSDLGKKRGKRNKTA